MKKIFWIFFLALFSCLSFAEKVATLTEIVNPYSFCIDEDRFYISEGVNVFIYSLKDYRLIKKFGNEGEGPGEVLLRRVGGNTEIKLFVEKDHIIVRTVGKVIYFSKDGDFVKEIKTKAVGRWLVPLGELYVGKTFIHEPDALYHGIVIYDSHLKKLKEIYKHIHGWQGPDREFNPLTIEQADFKIGSDKIFVINGARTKIQVYNKKGEHLFSITNKDEWVAFTEEDKKEMINEYRRNALWKRLYETKKHIFKFPKYFPPIRWFYLDPVDKNIYLKTAKKEKKKQKWLVFDFKGQLIKKILLPFGRLRFYNGICYRLLENEDEEEWELYVEKI